jgi:hypothetical protein
VDFLSNKKNEKLWEELITNFSFTTYLVSDTTRTAYKTQRPTFLLLRVYLLQQKFIYRVVASRKPSLFIYSEALSLFIFHMRWKD